MNGTPWIFNVRDFGATGDGQTLDMAALQAALDACHAHGGGTVIVPAGRYITGSIFLHSCLTLQLEAGAVLLGSENPIDYPIVHSRWEGAQQATYAPLITGYDLTDIAVIGRGTIDGRGAQWWQRFNSGTLAYPRPRLISFVDCSNVLIQGLTAINSPSWTINPVRCHNVTVERVTIVNPPDSPNTDGINPDSCTNVHIANCHIDVGDDCITIKSGVETEAADKRAACANITITNCTMAHGHGGVVIGSEMSGDVRNVTIANCVFVGTDRGLRFKSRRGRGGVVEDVRISNIVMTDVLCPLTMNLYYACGAWGDITVSDKQPQPVTEATPLFRHIHLSHITARNAQYAAAFLYGLAEMPLEDISLDDFSVSLAHHAEAGHPDMADDLEPMQRAGLFIRNVRGLRLNQIDVRDQLGAVVRVIDSADVTITACGTSTPDHTAPIVHLDNVERAFIQGCRAIADAPIFLQVDGTHSSDIALSGNDVRCAQLIALGADVRSDAVCW